MNNNFQNIKFNNPAQNQTHFNNNLNFQNIKNNKKPDVYFVKLKIQDDEFCEVVEEDSKHFKNDNKNNGKSDIMDLLNGIGGIFFL